MGELGDPCASLRRRPGYCAGSVPGRSIIISRNSEGMSDPYSSIAQRALSEFLEIIVQNNKVRP